jgi:hypothetical protein
VTDHAVTIDAAPKAVWPWLAQMGWHLGGYYTHLRVRGSLAPRWFGWIYQGLIVPADYVMALGMLHGIAKRAAARATPQPSGRIPYRPPAAAECNEMSPDAFIASAERSRPHRTRQTLGGTT